MNSLKQKLEIIQSILVKSEKESPFYVGVVVVSKDHKKMLFGKRKEDGFWTGPGGSAEAGEGPQQAAMREAFEEANLKLEPSDLKELPSLMAKNGKMVHCFMAFVDPSYDTHSSNDPDKEVATWNWYPVDKPVPGKMDSNRLIAVNAAKMQLSKLNKSKVEIIKAIVSNPAADIDLNTAEESQNELAAEDNRWVNILEKELENCQFGEAPREIPLPKFLKMYVSKVDDGIFSAFVKNEDPSDGNFGGVLTQLSKMTIISMVQALKVKGYLPRETAEKPEEQPAAPQIDQRQELAQILSQFSKPEVHVHIHKAEDLYYVSMDGDNIGNRVAEAEAKDDEKTLQEASQRINAGGKAFEDWAKKNGGTIIEAGGDEGLAKVPVEALKDIETFRKDYKETVKATVTVGTAKTISGSTKARMYGKLKGKDQVVAYSEEMDAELDKLIGEKDNTEIGKIKESKVFAKAELAQTLKKGKAMPVGTQRTWANGIKAVKHQDGWVVVGGEHHGKLMGKFKGEATHKEAADESRANEGPRIEYPGKKPEAAPEPEKKPEQPKEAEPVAPAAEKPEEPKAPEPTISPEAVKEATQPKEEPKEAAPEQPKLPEEIDPEIQAKTNMIKSVDFKKAGKKLAKQLHTHLNECNIVLAEMGVKFKSPINFSCSSNLKKTKRTRGTHNHRSNTITLKDMSDTSNTVMHEIGHALDYAMQEFPTMRRGPQRSEGRSAENAPYKGALSKTVDPELQKKYAQLSDIVTGSDYYEKIGKKAGSDFYNYLIEPTEVFARAFEVYSRVKAEELVKKGKIRAEFLDSFVPNIYKTKDPEHEKALEKHKELSGEYSKLVSKISAIRSEHHQEAAKKFPPPEYVAGTSMGNVYSEVQIKRNNHVDEALKDHPEYKELNAKLEALGKERSQLYDDKIKGKGFTEIPTGTRREYETKITEIMEHILKNDKIRKAIEKMDLAELLGRLTS